MIKFSVNLFSGWILGDPAGSPLTLLYQEFIIDRLNWLLLDDSRAAVCSHQS